MELVTSAIHKQRSQMGPSQAHPGPIWGPTLPSWGPTGAQLGPNRGPHGMLLGYCLVSIRPVSWQYTQNNKAWGLAINYGEGDYKTGGGV